MMLWPATPHHTRQAGYTLVEMTIVLGVLGVLIAGGLSVYSKRSETLKLERTQERLFEIDRAIQRFYALNGFLPCPADGRETEAAATFGVSDNAAEYDNSNANECDAPQADAGPPTFPELRGVVPVRTLGLADELMYDGWGRKFSYDLAMGMGDADDIQNEDYPGDIAIQNTDGQPLTDMPTFSGKKFAAAYVLFSHGKNGWYAWLKSGNKLVPNPATLASVNETANNAQNVAVGADYVWGKITTTFDDMMIYRTKGEVMRVTRPVRPLDVSTSLISDAQLLITEIESSGWGGVSAVIGSAPDEARLHDAIVDAANLMRRVNDESAPNSPRRCVFNQKYQDPDCICAGDLIPAKVLKTGFEDEDFGACSVP